MMSDPNDNSARSRRRRKQKNYALLILAAGMLAFGVAAGTLYYVLRPTTLRIAVGPAGSDDQKLVQLMAQTFAREGSSVRLSLVTTEGAAESIALFRDGKAVWLGHLRRCLGVEGQTGAGGRVHAAQARPRDFGRR